MKTFYTYLWLREDGTPYYVGKGFGDRAFIRDNHRIPRPKNKSRILVQDFPSEQDAFAAEKFLINYYGRVDLGTGCLRNLTEGGEGCSGRICKDETKQKIRQANSHPLSKSHREALSRVRKGKGNAVSLRKWRVNGGTRKYFRKEICFRGHDPINLDARRRCKICRRMDRI